MQDRELFDGVNGKYTDGIDENAAKKMDDLEIVSKSDAPRPRKLNKILLLFFFFLFLNVYNLKKMWNSCVLIYLAGLGRRHLQIMLLFGGLFFGYALRVNISVGIVAMVDKSPNATQPVSVLFINQHFIY